MKHLLVVPFVNHASNVFLITLLELNMWYYMLVCVFLVFSLHRESLDLITGDESLTSVVVLSQDHKSLRIKVLSGILFKLICIFIAIKLA
jgi:hypothetical protein